MRGVLLIAKQRTGTNMLRSALSNSSNIANIGECFHTETLSGPGNFFSWYSKEIGELPLIRSEAWVTDTINGYLKYIDDKFGPAIFDVKYNSVFSFLQNWHGPLEKPSILKVFQQNRYHVVHLVRENAIEHALSQLIAQATGVYVTYDSEALSGREGIEIDTNSLLGMAKNYRREIKCFDDWLRSYPGLTKVYYEKFVDFDIPSREEVLTEICRGCGANFAAYKGPGVKKIVKDWRENVANVEQVEAAIEAFDRDNPSSDSISGVLS